MLELKLLGSSQILLHGRTVSALSAAKSQALLFYLAVSGRPQSRLALAGLLWPEKQESDALANLRQAVYHLRKTLPQYLVITRLTLAINPDLPCIIDAICLEKESTATNPLAVRQAAVDRYTGEFLAGFYVEEAQPFEAWAVVMRERLHQLATEALHQLVTHFVAHQETGPGLRYTNQWLALEPWREEAHRHKMQFLAWDGQPQAALDQYERCRQALADELNLTPNAETVALYEQIRTGRLDKKTRDKVTSTGSVTLSPLHPVILSPCHDWGEAPAPAAFYGRQAEVALVTQWLGEDPGAQRARLVTILGMGGMGKTALAVQAAHRVADQFEVVIWRSLLNAPPLAEILPAWLQILSRQQLTKAPAGLDAQLTLLFGCLRQQRCLLILDNCESILRTGARAGRYRDGYEEYGQLLRRVGASEHQSTLLLTSREQPEGVALLPRETGMVQVLRMTGLEAASGQTLLQLCGLAGDADNAERIISHYSGNPLALQIVAQVVTDLFAGDLTAFLRQETLIFDDIRDVLDQQWVRLTPLEQEILLWLAIEREIVDLETLRAALVGGRAGATLLEALHSLQRRSLIEQRGTAFTLQNVVTEYLTDRLIDTIIAELVSGDWQRFHSHALIQAQAKEYVRESQIRIILAPLAEQLIARLGRDGLARRLQEGLAALRQLAPRRPGYAGGNALNLLLHLGYDLQGYDFSHLCLWQANLAGARLPAVNFTAADLTGAVFTEVFRSQASLVWSPDGELLATGAGGGEIRLWRVANRQLAGVCAGHTGYIWSLAFRADGRLLASASADQTVCVWDLCNRQLIHCLRGHTRGVNSVAWTADGRSLISGSWDQSICVWDVETGQARQILSDQCGEVCCLAVSPNDALLASGSVEGIVRLWDLAGGQIIHTLHHGAEVSAVAWSPDGRLLASAGSFVKLWDSATGARLATLAGTEHHVRAVAFSPDGSLLAASNDNTVRVWDVRTGQVQNVLHGHSLTVNAIAWNPDGVRLASLGARILVWDWPRGQIVATFQGYSDEVLSVAFRSDGALFASSHVDNLIRIWDALRGQVRHLLYGHTSWIRDILFSPDGNMLISVSFDQTIRLWDTQQGRLLQTLPAHEQWISCLALSADGARMATGSMDQTIWLWDLPGGRVKHTLRQSQSAVYGLAFSPNGSMLASGNAAAVIQLWDTHTGQPLATLRGHTKILHSLLFDRNGATLVSASADETIRFWDTRTGELLRTLHAHTAVVCELAANPARSILASCGGADQTVRLWDFASGAPLHVLQHGAWVVSITFSPDGQTFRSPSVPMGRRCSAAARMAGCGFGMCRQDSVYASSTPLAPMSA